MRLQSMPILPIREHRTRLTRFLAIAILAALIGALFTTQPSRAADTAQEANPVVIYMFWGDGCPHCAKAKPFLEDLAARKPNVELRFYEIYNIVQNRTLFERMGVAYDYEPRGVPAIYIADQHWEGWSDAVGAQIEELVTRCSTEVCTNLGEGVIGPNEGVLTKITLPKPEAQPTPALDVNSDIINIPLIGKIDLSKQSLVVSTALIGFVDGFNPCSVWVLTMLLALTLHTGSRKKVLIIGGIFLTVTAAAYALFIAGIFTILSFVSFMGWIQILVAVVALFFAIINVKDYFWYKEGVSFTIADEKKPGIAKGIRRVMDSKSFWGMAAATVALAAGVSLVEFTCTAGFPVMWSNILAAQNVTPLNFALLLLLYMVIYQLDELAIFLVAVFTLKASRLEEKHGRILKLIGGILMLTLAVVMLIKPALMNQLSSALLIFAIAFGMTALILLLHRRILPHFGVWIGTEARQPKKRGHHRPSPGQTRAARRK
jgi:cytochrome c biogenesis protein CcdA/glutaredoxin